DAEPADDDREHDAGAPVETVALERAGGCLAAVVGEQADSCRPGDAARGIPEQEPPPTHAREPGDPGNRVAQNRDEAAEEDRLAAVARHQRLGAGKHAVAVLV